MKDNNLYFENVPYIGSLFMEQLLFSFEDTPIVFICTDKELSRYLCVCDDIIDEESWLIVKINNTKLLEILNNASTVLSAFVGQKVIIANRKFNQSIRYEIEEYNNIGEDELPVCDQYLDMKNSLRAYIEKIENEILFTSFRLSIPINDVISDINENLDIPKVAISFKEKKLSETYCNNTTKDCVNSFSNEINSLKIECKKNTDESIALGEETELITYAA